MEGGLLIGYIVAGVVSGSTAVVIFGLSTQSPAVVLLTYSLGGTLGTLALAGLALLRPQGRT